MQSPAREHVAVPTQAPAPQVPELAVQSAAVVPAATLQVWAAWFQVPVHAALVAAARVQLLAFHLQPRGARKLSECVPKQVFSVN